jgi:hypothetical protein
MDKKEPIEIIKKELEIKKNRSLERLIVRGSHEISKAVIIIFSAFILVYVIYKLL